MEQCGGSTTDRVLLNKEQQGGGGEVFYVVEMKNQLAKRLEKVPTMYSYSVLIHILACNRVTHLSQAQFKQMTQTSSTLLSKSQVILRFSVPALCCHCLGALHREWKIG